MREIRCELRFEADADRRGPGRLRGVLLREGEPARTLPEEFARGALVWPEDGVVLNVQHDRQQPIVRFTPTREGDEIRVDVELPDTTRGRDAATMVRNGTMTGLSVEFRPNVYAPPRNGRKVVKRAVLLAAGLVDTPAYDTSVSVRSQSAPSWARTERWR